MAIVINGSGTVTGLAVGGLPDGTVDAGTLATNSVDSAELIDGAVDDSHIGALAASKLTGALPAISGASLTGIVGGKVLQVVKTSATALQTTTAASWVDTNLSLAITPSATTSKIHIQYSFQSVELTTANSGCSFRIMRDSTSVFTPSAGYSIYTSANGYWQYGDIELDSPSTTSAVTYKIQIKSYNSNAVNLSAGSLYKNTLILTEIAG